MCGRYTNTVTDPEVVAQTFDLETPPTDLAARFNIAPTQSVATIVNNQDSKRLFAWMQWGLIPSWAKEPSIGSKMFNARAETLAEKPSFRSAYRARRCLVVADGFYEWMKNEDGSKTPMYVHLQDRSLFGMAGLWEHWRDPETNELVTSCTVITTEPNELIKPMHHRMAVILPREHYSTWLDRSNSNTEQLQQLLRPYPAELMNVYAVSKRVNNANYDAADLIDPA